MERAHAGVVVPRFETPSVSIIIPVHGKWPLTRDCLASICADVTARMFEVIVVDDASPDDTLEQLECVPGVRVVRTPHNLGFVGACNLGAGQARGSVIVFLNNDTRVHPGWIDALAGTFDDANIGLAGSLLLSDDGRVQESGGIIWADGSGWNYGRGLDPTSPEVGSLRDVDYCSGAAIAVRAELFHALGGFDERFAPAYYEDTDLCFAVRAAGWRVVVNPAAIVTHLEGASNGRDDTGGLKRFQEVNRVVFRRKWASTLAAHGSMEGAHSLWKARHRRPAGMVLIVDSHVPTPDRDAGSRRMYGVVDQLLDMGLSVHIAANEHVAPEPYAGEMRARGVTILTSVDEQERFVREAGPALGLVILCRPEVAHQWLDHVYHWAPDALIAYDTVDLHGLRLHRQSIVQADPPLGRFANLVWSRERAAMLASDVTFVVSQVEKDLLATLAPGTDVRVLSLIHQTVVTQPRLAGRVSILFVGGYQHHPNVDGAVWTVDEILPLIRARVPEAVLRLVGSHMPPEVAALKSPGVQTIGWVSDLAPEYERARVVIAPLRFGAGVKGKVAEAIEHAVPVVGTTMALEGMDLEHGADVLCADTAEEFADAVVRLLTDDSAWRSMAGRGQAKLMEQFGPARAREVLEDVLSHPERTRQASTLAQSLGDDLEVAI